MGVKLTIRSAVHQAGTKFYRIAVFEDEFGDRVSASIYNWGALHRRALEDIKLGERQSSIQSSKLMLTKEVVSAARRKEAEKTARGYQGWSEDEKQHFRSWEQMLRFLAMEEVAENVREELVTLFRDAGSFGEEVWPHAPGKSEPVPEPTIDRGELWGSW